MKCCEIKSGELRHRVTIQQLSETRDSQGGFNDPSWSTRATVWAKITPVSTSQEFFSERLEHRITHKIFIRYRSDLNIKDRISYGSRIFQVQGFKDPDERKRFLEISAEEGSAS